MARKLISLSGVAALAVLVVACTVQTSDSTEAAGDTADAVSSSALRGSWSAAMEGLNLRPNGEYFMDRTAILNGFASPGGPPVSGTRKYREAGTYRVNSRSKKLTLSASDGSTRVYAYEYTRRVVNGVVGPGGSPLPTFEKLKLSLVKVNDNELDGGDTNFDRAESWCTQDADCASELADKTWNPSVPTDVPLAPKCNASSNACEMTINVTDRVVASCTQTMILNGLVIPSALVKAEISVSDRGFAPPLYSVKIHKKDGDEELSNCSGDLGAWDLSCKTPNGLMGYSAEFKLTDQSRSAATYDSQVVVPNAPKTHIAFNCQTN